MKLKYEFTIEKIGDNNIAVPSGSAIVDFNGILKLNETAAFIIEKLNDEISMDDLVFAVSEKFSCDKNAASENVEYIINGLKESNLLAE